MTQMFDLRSFVVSGECDLARAAAKASSWNCARCGNLRDGLPRGAVACEAPAGRGNSMGLLA